MADKIDNSCPASKSHECDKGLSLIRFSDFPCDQCRVHFFAEQLGYALEQYDRVRKHRARSTICSYWGKAVTFYGWALEMARKEIAENGTKN